MINPRTSSHVSQTTPHVTPNKIGDNIPVRNLKTLQEESSFSKGSERGISDAHKPYKYFENIAIIQKVKLYEWFFTEMEKYVRTNKKNRNFDKMVSCSTNATFKTFYSSNNILGSITTSNDTRSMIYKNELRKKGFDFSTKTTDKISTEYYDKPYVNLDADCISTDVIFSSIELPIDKSWINPLISFELKGNFGNNSNGIRRIKLNGQVMARGRFS